MSGGFFDYAQYSIEGIVDSIEKVINENDSTETDDWGYPISRQIPKELIPHFEEAVRQLQIAQIYAQRIDWYLSGDDNAQSFLDRLHEELLEFKSNHKQENVNG